MTRDRVQNITQESVQIIEQDYSHNHVILLAISNDIWPLFCHAIWHCLRADNDERTSRVYR